MTGFGGWLNAETMRLVGLALLHFLWQGAAIAALAFLAMSMVRRAAARYVVGVAMLALMVAAPAVTFSVLARRHEPVVAVVSAARMSKARQGDVAAISRAPGLALTPSAGDAGADSSIYLLWFVEAWFLGVVLLSLRPAAGFFLIERLRMKKGTAVTGALRSRCLELQRRLGLNRVVAYCESLQLEAPAVAGWLRPVVLLPVSALTGLSAQQLDAVIAHELAHVKRLDAFVNLFQIAAETLLFYHPAIWWLSKRVRAERENCCDDVAISVCGNAVEYARALATMAEWQSAPTLAMAANRSPLAERVARLLGVAKLSGGLRSAGIAGSVLCLCASLLAGNALLGAAQSDQPRTRDAEASAAAAPVVQPVPSKVRDRGAVIVVRPERPLPAPVVAPMVAPEPEVSPTVELAPVIAVGTLGAQGQGSSEGAGAAQDDQNQSGKANSYIDGLKAEGITDLSIDQLIALKIQGVTPAYVRAIHAAGLKPDVDELIAMRVQGVTAEIVREMLSSGLAKNIDQIIAMQVQGVTAEYVKQLHDLNIKTDADDVVAMKVQGVTPEYVRAMRDAVDPKLDTEDVIAMKVQDVTPEYVREMKGLGFPLDAEDIIAMKVQGVTTEYVKELQSAGLKLDIHEVIGAKVQGITPEFVERARKHGFQNLSMDKLMALKNSGLLDE